MKNEVRETIFKQLEKQPRTTDGVWWHKAIYANQVWLDGVYMGHPFYTMGAPIIKGEKKAKKYYDDAFTQISKTFNRTYDEKTGLWKHAWDETHTMFWADKETDGRELKAGMQWLFLRFLMLFQKIMPTAKR